MFSKILLHSYAWVVVILNQNCLLCKYTILDKSVSIEQPKLIQLIDRYLNVKI